MGLMSSAIGNFATVCTWSKTNVGTTPIQSTSKTIDAISIEGQNTALNMYETGQIDWVTDPPGALIGELKGARRFHHRPRS